MGRWRSLPEREEISPEEKLGLGGDGDGGWRSLREEDDLREEDEPEKMAARRSGGGGGSLKTAAFVVGVESDDGVKSVAGARSGGGGGTKACGGGSGGTKVCGGGGLTPSLAFLEQPLEREITPFFLQMTARVCWGGGGGGGGVPSPIIEPIMGREGKGPT